MNALKESTESDSKKIKEGDVVVYEKNGFNGESDVDAIKVDYDFLLDEKYQIARPALRCTARMLSCRRSLRCVCLAD